MNVHIKKFIEENISLIEEDRYEELYDEADSCIDIHSLTETLLEADIDPLQKLTYVPSHYLCETDIFSFSVPAHITEIKNGAFWQCENLNKVSLPEGLKKIGDSAFCECHNLWQVTLPSTLESLQEDAFAETNLQHLVIPDNIVTIPRHCFEECHQLKTLKLGKSVEILHDGCFGGCESLYYVQLNEGIKAINRYVFKECKNLKEIYIPDSVTMISPTAFFKTDLKIICSKGSKAHEFAITYDRPYELI